MSELIRLARPEDSDELLDIYAPYVRDTPISLEFDPPGREEYGKRVENISATYPYLVHVAEGRIVGYAYAAKFMEREGYRHDISVSVYFRPEAQRNGLASGLYSRLFALAAEQGYCNAYAIITLPNPASVGLHAKFGFTPAATLRRTGCKFGKWLDVLWMEKRLRDDAYPPEIIRGIGELPKNFVEETLTMSWRRPDKQ